MEKVKYFVKIELAGIFVVGLILAFFTIQLIKRLNFKNTNPSFQGGFFIIDEVDYDNTETDTKTKSLCKSL